jgi:hypothetical protein
VKRSVITHGIVALVTAALVSVPWAIGRVLLARDLSEARSSKEKTLMALEYMARGWRKWQEEIAAVRS